MDLFFPHTAEQDIFYQFQRAGGDLLLYAGPDPAGGGFVGGDPLFGPEGGLDFGFRKDGERKLARIDAFMNAAEKATGTPVVDVYHVPGLG
ncbi:hypothetical protein SDC9_194771 [bioreactor metagenome]|uniref:Uncharacterized protein n=1 Tax=bioreactor metagenome TaxID=1076179 RepID=A0A645I7S1_9ZZZZ